MNDRKEDHNIKYTIAVCNLNMAKTLEESLRSILQQVDDRFEVLVVDGGSTDGSIGILNRLKREYDNLRSIELEKNEQRRLGAERQISVREARGEYVLPQLDADDKYEEGILDFVKIYHQIEQQVDFDFYLKGKKINMAKRELLLDIPYRNVDRAQDIDLWRRLYANDAIIDVKNKPFHEEIGYHTNFYDRIKIRFKRKRTDLRAGVSFWSWVLWIWRHSWFGNFCYHLFLLFLAYLLALPTKQYTLPPKFRKMGHLKEVREKQTLSEIEKRYNIEIDKSKLSRKELFFEELRKEEENNE